MLSNLRARMVVLLLGFLLLVTGSVVATFLGLRATARDALVINLAGRQRMLIQQMTKVALQIEKGRGEERILALQEAARDFDQTLWALTNGDHAPYLSGRTVDLPATQSPDILAKLHQLRRTWNTFRGYLDVIIAADPNSPDSMAAVQGVERLSPRLVQQADDVVRLYEAASTQKVARLRWIQIVFFASTLALLAMDSLLIQRFVVEPLRVLGSAAERICWDGSLGCDIGKIFVDRLV
ncbi:MAG: type IV pili methyl-accepting chemotaxis transducer N-terminal domain-containing protein [Anaerolineae bacterium]